MKRLTLLLIGLLCMQFSIAQSYVYSFGVVGIDNPGDAKHAIIVMRDILGVRVITFKDDTDIFEITTHLDFAVGDIAADLESVGMTLTGAITKIYNE